MFLRLEHKIVPASNNFLALDVCMNKLLIFNDYLKIHIDSDEEFIFKKLFSVLLSFLFNKTEYNAKRETLKYEMIC